MQERMTYLNKELLLKRIQDIRESVEIIKQYKNISLDEFLQNQAVLDRVKYRFILAIEAAISMCNHISNRYGFGVPEGFAHCFKLLADHNVIKSELALELQKMSRFRNILVHLYWQVDNKQVYEIMQNYLHDFEDYIACVTTFTRL